MIGLQEFDFLHYRLKEVQLKQSCSCHIQEKFDSFWFRVIQAWDRVCSYTPNNLQPSVCSTGSVTWFGSPHCFLPVTFYEHIMIPTTVCVL